MLLFAQRGFLSVTSQSQKHCVSVLLKVYFQFWHLRFCEGIQYLKPEHWHSCSELQSEHKQETRAIRQQSRHEEEEKEKAQKGSSGRRVSWQRQKIFLFCFALQCQMICSLKSLAFYSKEKLHKRGNMHVGFLAKLNKMCMVTMKLQPEGCLISSAE